jgi:hypothetical protein
MWSTAGLVAVAPRGCYDCAAFMAPSDIILLVFIAAALAFRGRRSWKRTGAYVVVGIIAGDITGALLIAILYHRHPNVIYWARCLMAAGAVIGGISDWLGLSSTLNRIGQQ